MLFSRYFDYFGASSNELICVPTAGLANRLRGMDSAIWLAENLDRSVKLIWERNEDCHCKFSELFEIDLPEVKIVEITKRERVWLNRFGKRLGLNKSQVKLRVPESWTLSDEHSSLPTDFDALRHHIGARPVRIAGHKRTYLPERPYSWLRQKSKLSSEVENLINNLPRPIVGVHIRRADHHVSITHSPTSAFINAIANKLNTGQANTILLCTDDRSEEITVKEAFGERVAIYRKHSTGRDNPQAIFDAAVDFISLSRCDEIIGSAGSSFSDEAAVLGGINLKKLGQEAVTNW